MDNCAILIGISYYEETLGLETLTGVPYSIENMRNAFIKNCGCKKVFVFPNTDTLDVQWREKKVSGQEILRYISEVCDEIYKNDKTEAYNNLYLYYAGHGSTDKNGNACILPSDYVIVDQLDGISYGELQITTLLNMVRLCFPKRYNHLIVFIDACRSLADPEWDRHMLLPETFPDNTIVYYSTLPYQESHADREYGGIFTTALISVLQSELGTQTADKLNKAIRRKMSIEFQKQEPIMKTSCDATERVIASFGGYTIFPDLSDDETNEIDDEFNELHSLDEYGKTCVEEYVSFEKKKTEITKKEYQILEKLYADSSFRRFSFFLKSPEFCLRFNGYRDRFEKSFLDIKRNIDEMVSGQLSISKSLESCLKDANSLLRRLRARVHWGENDIYEKNNQLIGEDSKIFSEQLSILHRTAIRLETTIKILEDYRESIGCVKDSLSDIQELIPYKDSFAQLLEAEKRTKPSNVLIQAKTKNQNFYNDQKFKYGFKFQQSNK